MTVQNQPVATFNTETAEIIILTEMQLSCKNSTNCCRKNTIPVLEEDIQRIMDAGYELDQFIDGLSPVLVPDKTGNGLLKAYLLKKKPYSDECVFLQGNLCSIHAVKPFACKIYPFYYEYLGNTELLLKIHPQNVCENVCVGHNKQIKEQLRGIGRDIVEYFTNTTY